VKVLLDKMKSSVFVLSLLLILERQSAVVGQYGECIGMVDRGKVTQGERLKGCSGCKQILSWGDYYYFFLMRPNSSLPKPKTLVGFIKHQSFYRKILEIRLGRTVQIT
jgi:hypothetical protein